MGAPCSKPKQGAPEWNPESPEKVGCDRQVFVGAFRSWKREVSTVVHVSNWQGKKTGAGDERPPTPQAKRSWFKRYSSSVVQGSSVSSRFTNEMAVLSRLGAHPNIISMIHWGVLDAGSLMARYYMAFEDVQCELQWMVNYYMFSKDTVPGPMARSVAVDLSHAIDHMHSRQILHRDIKMESVLITNNYDAKLVDMGTACRLGLKEERWIWNKKEHRAYEICRGNMKLCPKVDCWGIGVVLHQMYQFRWDIIDSSSHVPEMRPGRPSIWMPMDPVLLQAMVAMLRLDRETRWNTKLIRGRVQADDVPGERLEWVRPVWPEEECRDFICRYRMAGAPITAYSVVIDSKSKHLIGKTVDEIGLNANDMLMLVDTAQHAGLNAKPRSSRRNVPSSKTVLREGSKLYFGLPGGEDTEVAIDRLERTLFPAMCKDKTSLRSIFIKPMTFGLEVDCFTFPDHIPPRSIIGQSRRVKATQLSVRARFGLNLVGIVKLGAAEPSWFPGDLTEVRPGDLGLVLRCPRPDGLSEPTVDDLQLEPLMSKESFERIMAKEPEDDAVLYNI